jgi:hypothetical protein
VNAHQRHKARRAAKREFPIGTLLRGVGGLWKVTGVSNAGKLWLSMWLSDTVTGYTKPRPMPINYVRKMHREDGGKTRRQVEKMLAMATIYNMGVRRLSAILKPSAS